MKRFVLPANAISRARRLRRDMTPQEHKLWKGLKVSFPEAHFRKQVPIGTYVADFAWHGAKLIIEVDGGQHGSDAGQAHDEKRTQFLEAEGYQVLRFWNSDVDQNLDGVLTVIANALPLVGRDREGARRVGAAIDSSDSAATQNISAADAAGPHPALPTRGRDFEDKPHLESI